MGSISSKIIVADLDLLSLSGAPITSDLPVQYCLFRLGIRRGPMSVFSLAPAAFATQAGRFIVAPQSIRRPWYFSLVSQTSKQGDTFRDMVPSGSLSTPFT